MNSLVVLCVMCGCVDVDANLEMPVKTEDGSNMYKIDGDKYSVRD